MLKDLICIIPARKGSKRIKQKNYKLFCEKPIIHHTITKLKKAKIFNEIFVSTDSEKIAKICKKLNVKVLKRSKKLSDDFTDTKTVIYDALIKIKKLKIKYNKVCCVYPTSVFFDINKFKQAIKLLSINTPYIFTAKEYEHPIHRSFHLNNKKKIVHNFKNLISKRTQLFKRSFYDGAQFYLGWKKSWQKKKDIFDRNSKFIILRKLESVDIDEQSDWDIAEMLFKLKKKNHDWSY